VDFLKKKVICHFFNHEMILKAVVDSWNVIPYGLYVFMEFTVEYYPGALLRFIQTLYAQKSETIKNISHFNHPGSTDKRLAPYEMVISASKYRGVKQEDIEGMLMWLQNEFKTSKQLLPPSINHFDIARGKLGWTWAYWSVSDARIIEHVDVQPVDDDLVLLPPPLQAESSYAVQQSGKTFKQKPIVTLSSSQENEGRLSYGDWRISGHRNKEPQEDHPPPTFSMRPSSPMPKPSSFFRPIVPDFVTKKRKPIVSLSDKTPRPFRVLD